jgi:hypothetical protein
MRDVYRRLTGEKTDGENRLPTMSERSGESLDALIGTTAHGTRFESLMV